MGKTKKRIAILLLVALLFNVFQVTVMATEPSTETNVNPLIAAKRQYMDGGTYTLNENITANGCGTNKAGAILVAKETKLDITGGNIHAVLCTGENCNREVCNAAIALWAHGTGTEVTISGGKYTNEGVEGVDHQDLIYASHGGKITITGGEFKASTPQWTLNCLDRSGSTITVTGGRFYQFDPSNAKVAPAGYTEVVVPNDYKVIGPDSEGYYEVIKRPEIVAKRQYMDGGTYTLNENITANGCGTNKAGAILVAKETKLDITGGNIHAVLCTGENCNREVCNAAIALWAHGTGTEVTISGGKYTNEGVEGVDHQDLIYASHGGKITITGGEFKASTPQWTLNCLDRSGSTITVKGGKFYQFDPSNTKVAPVGETEVIVEEGYKVVGPDAEGYYEVVCAHTSLNHSVEKEPTYIENGEREHFACTNCSKLFLDEAATMEVAKADLVIPKLVQVSGSDANVKDEAVDSAIKDSNITDSTTVTIPLGSLGTTVDTVTLPVESLEKVVSENKDLTITTTEATATIDNKALDSIVEQAGKVESIKIEIKEIESTTLNKDQKKAIKNKSVAAVISAEIIANGKTISNFGGGKIKLEIPFTPEKDSKASDYKVVYIADNGDITEIPTAYKDGNLVVELEHFSEYAIVNVAKASSSSNSSAGAAPAAPVKDATPKTGSTDISLVVMSLVGTIALAGVVVIKRYSK